MADKIKSLKVLMAVRDKTRAEMDVRDGDKDILITVHMGTCGIAAGAREVLNELANQLSEANVKNVSLRQSGCIGLCSEEPMLTIKDKTGQETRYGKLDTRKVKEIVEEHVLGGNLVEAYMLKA
jgi:NADP-reducing hydrogenase subunit HndB